MKKRGFIFFLIIWAAEIIIFLNLYPGTLSCDTPNQLSQAMLDSEFENANPLINTLILTFFVQIGVKLSGVNLGVALYSFFQLTLYAVVTTYCLLVFGKRGLNKLFILVCLVFYALNPINLLYGVGMWKDSFFAILFVATLAYTYDSLYEKMDYRRCLFLFGLALLASLSRNSGWSSLLVFAISLGVYVLKHKEREVGRIAFCIGCAAALSVVIAFVLLPQIGIGSGGSNVARSIPLQQIARTVRDNELTEKEKEDVCKWLREGGSYEDIGKEYIEDLSDPMKSLFDGAKINKEKAEFNKLYRTLGKKYYRSFGAALFAHTKAYFWPGTSSWRFDNRIFDNPYGVKRTAILKPGVDIAATVYESYLSRIPFFKAWNSGAMVLWLTVIGMIACARKKKALGFVFYVPVLMIFLGLIPVSPAALFRYMYAAFLAKPFLLAFQFIK